ncbi:hypothetical protein NLI96_g10578 [Meripilus lineatus]|uniref:ABC transporter domain-containing protein n=1 Tax=Meripilus lineatus TaxID=2056292 RepID=A0AAD5YE73_9APHY|nr:hypothetical protein NLI96_g10578 [Physisporinus lineatus]
MPEKTGTVTADELHSTLAEAYLGVWRVVYTRVPSLQLPGGQSIDDWKRGYNYLRTCVYPFFLDAQRLFGPCLFSLYVLNHLWSGIEGALLLYLLNELLKQIELAYIRGTPDVWAIGSILSMRLLCVGVAALVRWLSRRSFKVNRSKIFDVPLLITLPPAAHLSLDLAAYSDSSNRPNIDPAKAWDAFREIFGTFSVAFTTISHIAFIWNMTRGQEDGLTFAFLCLARPLFTHIFTRNIWSTNFILYAVNPNYLRSLALNTIATTKQFKQEVLSGSLEEYLQDGRCLRCPPICITHFLPEFQEVANTLEASPDEFPSELFSTNPTPLPDIIKDILGDLPLVRFSLLQRKRFSITSLAMYQRTTTSLRSTIDQIIYERTALHESLHHLEVLYGYIKPRDTKADCLLPYPLPDSDPEEPKKEGMAISARNLSFCYPRSPDQRLVLKDVTFDIPASSLVVIVGANGSGKSSLVKLLCSLYNPTLGTILIDGKSANEYRRQDLRRATAVLTQDHLLFPLSISENISIGDPSCEDSPEKMERIRIAAKMGGAEQVIEKLAHGFEEMTRRMGSLYTSEEPPPPGPLKDIADAVEEYPDFSGGETQRLVASRTFMRLSSGSVKLVVADEPTSAMDPEGEFELFEALRKVKGGKTMIFITHRFGHLTKYADLILCLRDGELVESGVHDELMDKKGEYYRLYDIQASAFRMDTSSSPVEYYGSESE